jgi:putative ATP-dependent endonuclease of the OLD family
MKLVSTTIKNFRSITSAYKIPLQDFSVLVGPNNQGKSNVLVALVMALRLLERGSYSLRKQRLQYRYARILESYNWTRDFPILLQAKEPNGRSEVTLEFKLLQSEITEFKEQTKVNLSTNLKLKIHFSDDDARVELLLQGKAKQKLTDSSLGAIAKFVAERVLLQYIPAIRPAEMAEEAIHRILSDRLLALSSDPKYQASIAEIEKLQRPVLDTLANELTQTIRNFIPEVSKISLSSPGSVASAISRSAEVSVDDGAKTLLQMKGDGIKSLVAISLMKHVGDATVGSRSLILAIEEPESHLHPEAIHRLRKVLSEISRNCQVILTTHSVPLVGRERPDSNIIVNEGKAAPAKTLDDVRKALGVRQSDNLASARLIVLLEGAGDIELLRAWLSRLSPKIDSAIANGDIAFDVLAGAGNLDHKVRLHKANICAVHAFLDDDDAGRRALEKATQYGSIETAEYHLCSRPGHTNTELEDLVPIGCYQGALSTKCGFPIDEMSLKKNEKKYAWSERMKVLIASQNKSWTTKLEFELKQIVAAEASKLDHASIYKMQPIRNLAQGIELRLASSKQ